MFDSSFLQVVVFGVVGALLVGPKDLPMVARKFGGVLGKGVGLISRTRNSVQSFIRENELTHVQQDFERSLQQIRQVQDEVKQGLASPILQSFHRDTRTNYSSFRDPALMHAMPDSSSTSYRAIPTESRSPSGVVQRSSLATCVAFQTSRIISHFVILSHLFVRNNDRSFDTSAAVEFGPPSPEALAWKTTSAGDCGILLALPALMQLLEMAPGGADYLLAYAAMQGQQPIKTPNSTQTALHPPSNPAPHET